MAGLAGICQVFYIFCYWDIHSPIVDENEENGSASVEPTNHVDSDTAALLSEETVSVNPSDVSFGHTENEAKKEEQNTLPEELEDPTISRLRLSSLTSEIGVSL